VAEDLGVPLLGQLPLAMSIRQQADGGHPTVKAEPDSAISELYRDAARNMAARLWGNQGSTPTISMVDD
jgi:ATP-binding protein involved in chromosome partitioning